MYNTVQGNYLEGYKTFCCKQEPKRIGRAHLICPKCEKDVTLEMVLVYQANAATESIKKSK